MRPSVRPVGPLPASVYWKRRAIVLLVILPVLWAVGAWLMPDDDPDAQAPVTSSSGSPSPAPSSSPSSSRSQREVSARPEPANSPASKSSKPRPSAKQTKLPPGQYPACQAPGVSVEVDANVLPAGKPLPIKVTYVNESSGTCQVPISPSELRLTVISGTDRIWDTADCEQLIPSAPLTLKQGKPRTITITWPGRRSGADCPADGDPAKPGYYAVKLTVGEVAVSQARFRLT